MFKTRNSSNLIHPSFDSGEAGSTTSVNDTYSDEYVVKLLRYEGLPLIPSRDDVIQSPGIIVLCNRQTWTWKKPDPYQDRIDKSNRLLIYCEPNPVE